MISGFRGPGHHQGSADRRRAAAAPRACSILVRALVRLRTVEGEPLELAVTTNGHFLDRVSCAAQGSRTQPGYGQHGRGRRPHLRAHHPGSGQLCNRTERDSGRARSRSDSVEDQLCIVARFQRGRDRGVCPVCAPGRRGGSVHRVHAIGRGPAVDAGDCGASKRNCRAHRAGAAAGGAAGAGFERNGAAVRICRWGGRDRHYCAGEPGFLRVRAAGCG